NHVCNCMFVGIVIVVTSHQIKSYNFDMLTLSTGPDEIVEDCPLSLSDVSICCLKANVEENVILLSSTNITAYMRGANKHIIDTAPVNKNITENNICWCFARSVIK
ncbi:unnamed protein product, partial [Owenia fusiformis]